MSRMQRPEIYDGHVSVSFKKELEEAARSRETSVDELLEQIVREWLVRFRERGADQADEERQGQMRAAAMKLAGVIEGDDPDRAENAGAIVRSRLARKYGR
jgi:hypothetical protein